MAAIYITAITIAMLNITGIGFVIFMLLFNYQSGSQLKKANIKKSSTINDLVQNSIGKDFALSDKSKSNFGDHKITRTGGGSTSSVGTSVFPKSKSNVGRTVGTIATGTAAAVAAESSIKESGVKKSGDFDNIDDILEDLDLSDFDNLDLDDFS